MAYAAPGHAVGDGLKVVEAVMGRVFRRVTRLLGRRLPAARRARAIFARARLVLWGRLRERRYRQRPTFTTTIDGIDLTFATEDSFSRLWFYGRHAEGEAHEPQVTALLVDRLRHSQCFADVGANLGYYTCLLTPSAPGLDLRL